MLHILVTFLKSLFSVWGYLFLLGVGFLLVALFWVCIHIGTCGLIWIPVDMCSTAVKYVDIQVHHESYLLTFQADSSFFFHACCLACWSVIYVYCCLVLVKPSQACNCREPLVSGDSLTMSSYKNDMHYKK